MSRPGEGGGVGDIPGSATPGHRAANISPHDDDSEAGRFSSIPPSESFSLSDSPPLEREQSMIQPRNEEQTAVVGAVPAHPEAGIQYVEGQAAVVGSTTPAYVEGQAAVVGGTTPAYVEGQAAVVGAITPAYSGAHSSSSRDLIMPTMMQLQGHGVGPVVMYQSGKGGQPEFLRGAQT